MEAESAPRIAGVILAAGGSQRLGQPKQLLNWQGKPFVTQIALKALQAGLSPVIMVTGANHSQVEAAVKPLPLMIVYNPHWSEGQSTSMQAGLNALPKDCEGLIFLLSDQPHIPVELITGLIERFSENRLPIVAPKVEGKRGNPVLFGRKAFPALRQVRGDRGGRGILNQFEMDWLPWKDARILLDVDNEGDLQILKQAYQAKD